MAVGRLPNYPEPNAVAIPAMPKRCPQQTGRELVVLDNYVQPTVWPQPGCLCSGCASPTPCAGCAEDLPVAEISVIVERLCTQNLYEQVAPPAARSCDYPHRANHIATFPSGSARCMGGSASWIAAYRRPAGYAQIPPEGMLFFHS